MKYGTRARTETHQVSLEVEQLVDPRIHIDYESNSLFLDCHRLLEDIDQVQKFVLDRFLR